MTDTCVLPQPRTDSSPPSDAELLAATARGDERSFEQLHARHVDACRRRAAGVLATEEWVSDVVQAVFLDVWRHADRFDGRRTSARGWLLALTHHKAVDLIRERERHNTRWAHEMLLDGHVDPAPGPDLHAAARDAADRVRTALEEVPEPHRETLRLCFLRGLSQRETAAELAIPLGTVKTRSRQGIIALRGLVETSLRA